GTRPPAPGKDIRMDQQLAALLTAWWGSGDLDAARVLADARGRSQAAGDRDGIGTVLLAMLRYLNTQDNFTRLASCPLLRRARAVVRAVTPLGTVPLPARHLSSVLRRT